MSLGKDFLPRLASALVLGPLVLFAIYRGGWLFALVLAIAGILTLWEWVTMTAAQPKVPLLGLGGISLATATAAVMLATTSTGLTVLLLGLAAVTLIASRKGWTAAGFLYAGVIVLAPLLLRLDPVAGMASILWLCAVVWTTDIAAYFCGRLIGGPKLCPAISPNKTWSGAIGGTLFGTLAGLLVARLFHVELHLALIPVSLVASIASQCGDLYESSMKRRFGVKDSSALIPGHGGLMDRLDGFIAAAAFAILLGLLRNPAAPAQGLLLW